MGGRLESNCPPLSVFCLEQEGAGVRLFRVLMSSGVDGGAAAAALAGGADLPMALALGLPPILEDSVGAAAPAARAFLSSNC